MKILRDLINTGKDVLNKGVSSVSKEDLDEVLTLSISMIEIADKYFRRDESRIVHDIRECVDYYLDNEDEE